MREGNVFTSVCQEFCSRGDGCHACACHAHPTPCTPLPIMHASLPATHTPYHACPLPCIPPPKSCKAPCHACPHRHACPLTTHAPWILQDTANERVVRTLLECILVFLNVKITQIYKVSNLCHQTKWNEIKLPEQNLMKTDIIS